jgi:hypothetical protein
MIMKQHQLKARSKNIHKSKATTSNKSASLVASDSLIKELIQLNSKNSRGKLAADGKERLKVLQDRYASIQAQRKRIGLELMPEVEDLFVEQMIREPVEPYPFEFSDEEPLPTLEGLAEPEECIDDEQQEKSIDEERCSDEENVQVKQQFSPPQENNPLDGHGNNSLNNQPNCSLNNQLNSSLNNQLNCSIHSHQPHTIPQNQDSQSQDEQLSEFYAAIQ